MDQSMKPRTTAHNPRKPRNLWSAEERASEISAITRYRHNLRQMALLALGGKCVVCGFSDSRALQIDHINGGGSGENKQFRSRAEQYRHIINGNTDGLQILCAKHNWIKRHERKEWGGGKKRLTND
jgi:hypothetical protein